MVAFVAIHKAHDIRHGAHVIQVVRLRFLDAGIGLHHHAHGLLVLRRLARRQNRSGPTDTHGHQHVGEEHHVANGQQDHRIIRQPRDDQAAGRLDALVFKSLHAYLRPSPAIEPALVRIWRLPAPDSSHPPGMRAHRDDILGA